MEHDRYYQAHEKELGGMGARGGGYVFKKILIKKMFQLQLFKTAKNI